MKCFQKISICVNFIVLFASSSYQVIAQSDVFVTDGCYKEVRYHEHWSPQYPILPLASGWAIDSSLSDEFNNTWVDTLKWYVFSGCHLMSSKSEFRKNQNTFSADGQHLYLKVARLPQPKQCSNDTIWKDFESGYITASKYVRYGYFGIRMKYPCNVNLNPCFWFKGATTDIVQGDTVVKVYDEIDGLEFLDFNADLNLLRNSVIHGHDEIPGTDTVPAEI